LAQNDSQSRIYEVLQPLEVGLLADDAARAMLAVPIERQKLSLPAGAVDHLLALAGPQPFFLQLAGYYLYESLFRREYTRDHVARKFKTAAAPFWQEMWASLSPLAKAHFPLTPAPAIPKEAAMDEEATMAARQRRILSRRCVVIEDDRGCRPFSEGFAEHVRRLKEAEATAAALAAALNPA
jgi:hypothetical protein